MLNAKLLLLVLLSAAARCGAASDAWKEKVCRFQRPDALRAGEKLCCEADEEFAPTVGSRYRAATFSAAASAAPGEGCDPSACWRVEVACDGAVSRAPDVSCGGRGDAADGAGPDFPQGCERSARVCFVNEDRSRWPREYCGRFVNVTLKFEGTGVKGPPSLVESLLLPAAVAAAVAATALSVRVLAAADPTAAACWRLADRWPVRAGVAALLVLCFIFPRAFAAEARVLVRVAVRLVPVAAVLVGAAALFVLRFKRRPQSPTSSLRPPTHLADAATLPAEYKCPITMEVMTDPVVAQDGHTYERSALQRWFALRGPRSPVTGQVMAGTGLVPNHSIRSQIMEENDRVGRESRV
eukprot:TRINITY_DN2100_c0_g1_i1.p1 TRINITY_DN2100_c0_g1~~TRINITY_DN2100_c0_g1_i1.p1  ORF type:complete len:391 (+),score=112.68 TRINITY_DN2100_c0_g1_i1:112-1173(+)